MNRRRGRSVSRSAIRRNKKTLFLLFNHGSYPQAQWTEKTNSIVELARRIFDLLDLAGHQYTVDRGGCHMATVYPGGGCEGRIEITSEASVELKNELQCLLNSKRKVA